MGRQCAWCKDVYDIHTKKWIKGSGCIEQGVTHGMCPRCKDKLYQELNERKNRKEEY